MTLVRDDPDFETLIRATSNDLGITDPTFVEKDYWVTQVLRVLNNCYPGGFLFKGGTSLSKGYSIIQRFSEDVDVLAVPPAGATNKGREKHLLKMSEPDIAEAGIGRKFQKPTVFEQLPVATNLELAMRAAKGVWHSLRARLDSATLDRIAEKNPGANPVDVLQRAIDNAKPRIETKARRVGGATYQVPMEVPADRQTSLAIRWLVGYADDRKGIRLEDALASEVMEAYQGQGNAIRKRDDVHKMAQANKAFAHFRY